MAPVLMALQPMEIMAPPVSQSDLRHLFYRDQNCHINTEMEIQ